MGKSSMGEAIDQPAVPPTAAEVEQDKIAEWLVTGAPWWDHPHFATVIERPDIFERDGGDEMVKGGYQENGPWLAVVLENGDCISGELVAPIDDVISLRMYVQLGADKGKDFQPYNESISIFDASYPVARVQVWFTTEGDRWSVPLDEADPLEEMGVHDFPRRTQ